MFAYNSAEKHARASENNGENSGARKRKERWAKKAAIKDHESGVNQERNAAACGVTAKGKEIVRWYRVDIRSEIETNADATSKGHSTCTGNQEEAQMITTTTTLGTKAYRIYVAKETVREPKWATLLAQVPAQIQKERRDCMLRERRVAQRLWKGFRDEVLGSQDGNHNKDDSDSDLLVQIGWQEGGCSVS